MNGPGRRIARARLRARAALAWEAARTALWPAPVVAAAFLVLALGDVLPGLGGPAHLAVLLAFAGWLGWYLFRAWRRFRLPGTAEADRQIERASGLAHRPLTTLSDRPIAGDEEGQAFWKAHVARTFGALGVLRSGLPDNGIPRRDPWALRILAFVVLAAAFAWTGRDAEPRILRALAPEFSGAEAPPVEVDVWVEPPAYTGRPVLFATGRKEPLEVPVGSIVHARVVGGDAGTALVIGGEEHLLEHAEGSAEGSVAIRSGPRIEVVSDGRELAAWDVIVTPDDPPTVRFDSVPRATRRHALRIGYGAGDDYGVEGIRAEVRPTDEPDAGALRLPLPNLGDRRSPQGVTYVDLTAHIWAGRKVSITAVAVDGAGQEGRSGTLRIVLPERIFTHPVARMIVAARRELRATEGSRREIAARLRGISDLTALYDGDAAVFLSLNSAAARLLEGGDDGAAVDAVRELLWVVALDLEDGDLSLADRELRAAQQALWEALERGADDREIERLIDELARAIERMMREMAAGSEEGEDVGAQPEADGLLGEQDLARMVEQLRELWRSGARDRARALLAQLRNVLENMRRARMGEGQAELASETMRMINELRSLTRDQRSLLDRTFRAGRPPGEGEQGARRPEDGGMGNQFLAGGQERLRRRLEEFMRRLGERGGESPGGFGQAERSMDEAAGALRQGRMGDAVEAQGRALQGLQQAGNAMMRELARQLGLGQGEGTIRISDPQDPFGRYDGGFNADMRDVELPDAEDFESDLQRARRIRDELRRRAGDRSRPESERDYIDRLLRRF